jgi:hypothetical protein
VRFVHIQKHLIAYMIWTYNHVIKNYENKEYVRISQATKEQVKILKGVVTVLSDTTIHLQLWVPGQQEYCHIFMILKTVFKQY